MKPLSELTEREVLALAIANEEEDSRIYQSFADRLRADFPASAELFDDMAEEERGPPRHPLRALSATSSASTCRRSGARTCAASSSAAPSGGAPNLDLDRMRREAEVMELQAANFYDKRRRADARRLRARALRRTSPRSSAVTSARPASSPRRISPPTRKPRSERAPQRLFVLQYVQPGLAGLIDGSVSTLAPLFAAAFATQSNWETFLVGLAASIGAGISMGFTEALSDDGAITGRGSPWLRGVVCGLMTALGGLGHTLPYLVPDAWPNAFRSPPPSPPSSSRSSSSRSPGSARATWTRRSCSAAFQVDPRRRAGAPRRHPHRQRLTRRPGRVRTAPARPRRATACSASPISPTRMSGRCPGRACANS